MLLVAYWLALDGGMISIKMEKKFGDFKVMIKNFKQMASINHFFGPASTLPLELGQPFSL